MPKVSAIITSYNQRDYLVEALESVLAQTRPVDEIIVADDFSQDGSQKVIDGYAQRYPDLVRPLCQQQNLGIPQNRNAALATVTGDYVSILDGDDRFMPRKVERELAALAAHSAASVVYANYRHIDPAGRAYSIRYRHAMPSGRVHKTIATGCFGMLRAMLGGMDALRRVGFMDERFPEYDGFDLTLRLSLVTDFVYIAEPLVEKREHPSSVSKVMAPGGHESQVRGIYDKNRHLIDALPPDEAAATATAFLGLLVRMRTRLMLRENDYAAARRFLLVQLGQHPNWLRSHASLFLETVRLGILPRGLRKLEYILRERSVV